MLKPATMDLISLLEKIPGYAMYYPYNLESKDIDHILIEYSCIDKSLPKPVLEIYWATENDPLSEKTVVRFFATGNSFDTDRCPTKMETGKKD